MRLKCVCDSDEKFTVCSNEPKNYLIVLDYKTKVVEKYFCELSKLSRAEPRQTKPKQQANDRTLFATTYNPKFPNMRSLIKKHLPVLHYDHDLKEILAPSMCTKIKMKRSCGKKRGKGDASNNYLISDNTFTCKITNKKYYIHNDFDCTGMNVIYLTSCTNCNEQYVGSAIDFKKRFRIHKSDIIIK